MRMQEILLPKGAKIVSVIRIPKFLDPLKIPSLLDYTHPKIVETIPCIKTEKGLESVFDGTPVQVDNNSLVWPVYAGTVFQYPNGEKVLLSRAVGRERNLMLLWNDAFRYSETSMGLVKIPHRNITIKRHGTIF